MPISLKKLIVVLFAATITACGGDSSEGDSSQVDSGTSKTLERPRLTVLDPQNPNPNNSACNAGVTGEVNWDAVTTEVNSFAHHCEKLSDYNFFADPSDPTKNLNNGAKSAPYAMNTELFTDYASKYRFVVMPTQDSAQYMAQETFLFPVGTVLIKTFALPTDTSVRGIDNEEKIETRLLIKRSSGWIALPYVWNADYSDAQLTAAPINLERTMTHDGVEFTFDYGIPGRDQCTSCHNVADDITDPTGHVQSAGFSPIGPKARHLNSDYAYSSGVKNQLSYWADNELLANLPDLSQVDAVPTFDGDQGLDSTDLATLQNYAKGYLDINCAHCHRAEGKAKSTGLFVPYWLDYDGNKVTHGKCKTSLTSTKADTVIDLVEGDADASLIHYRMSITSGEKMPELGRNLVHKEGLKLVADWINTLPYEACL